MGKTYNMDNNLMAYNLACFHHKERPGDYVIAMLDKNQNVVAWIPMTAEQLGEIGKYYLSKVEKDTQ